MFLCACARTCAFSGFVHDACHARVPRGYCLACVSEYVSACWYQRAHDGNVRAGTWRTVAHQVRAHSIVVIQQLRLFRIRLEQAKEKGSKPFRNLVVA
jgi:hypothetical protein